MKALTLVIEPLKGFGELSFGMTIEQVTDFMGKPDDQDLLDDLGEEETLIYHYDDYDISIFFEGTGDDKKLVNIETGNPEVKLFGTEIFDLNEEEIIKLMKKNKFTEVDDEILEDEEHENEKRVSFDEAMIDFFFEDEELTAVSWGNFSFDEE